MLVNQDERGLAARVPARPAEPASRGEGRDGA
jgi:hypothetical protein